MSEKKSRLSSCILKPLKMWSKSVHIAPCSYNPTYPTPGMILSGRVRSWSSLILGTCNAVLKTFAIFKLNLHSFPSEKLDFQHVLICIHVRRSALVLPILIINLTILIWLSHNINVEYYVDASTLTVLIKFDFLKKLVIIYVIDHLYCITCA